MKKIIVILSIVCIVAMESCNQDTVLENMSLQDIESVNYICPFPISVLFALSKSGDIVGMDDAYHVGKGVAASALGLIQKYFDRSVALSNLGWSLYRQGKRNRYSLAVDRGLSAPGCTMDAYYDSSRRTIFFKTLLTTPANERVVLHEVLHLFQCEIRERSLYR